MQHLVRVVGRIEGLDKRAVAETIAAISLFAVSLIVKSA
jgi:tRNA G37 N-methylase TrmD